MSKAFTSSFREFSCLCGLTNNWQTVADQTAPVYKHKPKGLVPVTFLQEFVPEFPEMVDDFTFRKVSLFFPKSFGMFALILTLGGHSTTPSRILSTISA